MDPTITPTTVQELASLAKHENALLATRYLTLIGLVLLLHDHAITFKDERRLVWRAPHSFAKYAFITNRYLVPSCIVAVSIEMCGFSGLNWSNHACQTFLFAVSMLAICSIALGNFLVLMRVCLLWDGNRTMTRTLMSSYVVFVLTQFSLLLVSLLRVVGNVKWDPLARICLLTKTDILFPVAWAVPMLFELLVLASTCLNALSRPRPASEKLAHALQRDGIVYFVAISVLRALNLSLAATLDPALAMLAIFFVWAMVTLVLNRSLLSLRRAEEAAEAHTPVGPEITLELPRPRTPFDRGALAIVIPSLNGAGAHRRQDSMAKTSSDELYEGVMDISSVREAPSVRW